MKWVSNLHLKTDNFITMAPLLPWFSFNSSVKKGTCAPEQYLW